MDSVLNEEIYEEKPAGTGAAGADGTEGTVEPPEREKGKAAEPRSAEGAGPEATGNAVSGAAEPEGGQTAEAARARNGETEEPRTAGAAEAQAAGGEKTRPAENAGTRSEDDAKAQDGAGTPEPAGEAETVSQADAPDGEEASAADGAETDAGRKDGEAGDGPTQSSDGKWHVFGRKKEKKDAKDQKIEELTDQLRRQMAEFDNFRKRTEKEKSSMFEVGARSIIEKILPVIDNFERGLAAVPEDVKGTPFAEGMEMIYKQLLKNLEEAGVKPIEAVGQPFDPEFHNAVMHVENEELGENVVVQEFQKGYMYRDTVIRHSMVQVAN